MFRTTIAHILVVDILDLIRLKRWILTPRLKNLVLNPRLKNRVLAPRLKNLVLTPRLKNGENTRNNLLMMNPRLSRMMNRCSPEQQFVDSSL